MCVVLRNNLSNSVPLWYDKTMENRVYFSVRRKSILTWLVVLFMAGSAMSRIMVTCMRGAESSSNLWCQIILPMAASLLYAFFVIYEGNERLYKTTIPVMLLTVYFCFQAKEVYTGFWPIALCWGIYLIFAVVHVMLTNGKLQNRWPLVFSFFLICVLLAWEYKTSIFARAWGELVDGIPDVMILVGFVVMLVAMRPEKAAARSRWGDRCDGRRLRKLDPMMVISCYFMVHRNEATNYYEDALEVSELDAFIHKKRREGYPQLGFMHLLLAAYVRTTAAYPGLNRFIAGQRVYSRDEDIVFSMVVKKEMKLDGEETVIKLHLNPEDTLETVYTKFAEAVSREKSTTEATSSYDHLVRLLNLVPGLVLKFVVWLLRLMDYFGLLPKALLELSPFHASVFFTSMGSLNIAPVYHHLYNFGNLPVFLAFGRKRVARELKVDGTMVTKRYIDIRVSLDERTVDGFYYASAFQYLKSLLKHPEQLLESPAEVIRDVE